MKAQMLEGAKEDMDVLRAYLHTLAEDARRIQPEVESE
ncbi:hypothetical protein MBEHAL_2662 [Halarchaeum acidiphilum MH1-52-1]|uniref:DUF7389 domain-containing protein n=1 Tax=Halarchaeum acidiphilum MH1-52-1 TaxID=1261545 RepID=U2YYN1_9EURY|nr:hypothetical protein MBEHAL_2662 [Halarchaeum acidiphilum MH1-52-1]